MDEPQARQNSGRAVTTLAAVLTFTTVPVLATLVGGALAAWRVPGAALRSAVQHFAGGLVFAAVATELIPEIKQGHEPLGVVIGFVLGVGVMLGLRYLLPKAAPKEGDLGAVSGSGSLVTVVALDVLIDGLLIGVSFAAGARTGILLTLALTLELLFLSLSTVASLGNNGAPRARVVAVVALMAGLLVAGAVVGGGLLAGLQGIGLEIVLAFGAAALLYLVTEELLVEAHEVPETAALTATFFAGFLALLLIDMVV